MAVFNGMTLTNKGLALQGKAQAGAQLNYTRFAIGDGSLTGQSIPALNGLISSKMSLPITRLRTQPPNKVMIGTALSNESVTTGFFFREIGVFATDPDLGEILYAYANAGATADYIAPGGGSDIIERTIDCIVVIGTAANITANIDNSLVFARKADLDAHASAATLDHPDGSVKDAKIGSRTISDTAAPTGDSGTITTLFGWLANMIKAITGGSTWRTTPVKSLAALNTEKAPIASPTFTGTATAPAFASTVATGTAPLAVASTTLVTNLNADKVDGLDASTASSINTVAARDGSGDLSARVFKSTVATGTAPFTVTSTTVVPNLNVNYLDGKMKTDFIYQPQLLGPSTDLNGLNGPGMYYCDSNATAGTMANCPTTNAFSLLVERHAGVKQTLTEYHTTGGGTSAGARTWTRNYYSSTWGSWYRVWDARNQGSGSGMDADLLDGMQASVAGASNIVARDSGGATNLVALVLTTSSGIPLLITSTTMNPNLNADMVDGYHAQIANSASTIPVRSASGDVSATTFTAAATGAAPFTVASTIVVPNLNADMVDGYHVDTTGTAVNSIPYRDGNAVISANRFNSLIATGTAPLAVQSTTMVTNLNADMVDGLHAASFFRIDQALADLTLYVSPTGSDANNGLTTSTPLLTLTAAWNKIKNAGGGRNLRSATIRLMDGTYTDASTNVSDLDLPAGVTINSQSGVAANVIFPWIYIANSKRVKIKNITITGTTNNGLTFDNCDYSEVDTVTMTAAASSYHGVLVTGTGSRCRVVNCTLSNRYFAIYAFQFSTIYSDTNGGTGNNTGLYAERGSRISKYSTQPAGTTAETAVYGSAITTTM